MEDINLEVVWNWPQSSPRRLSFCIFFASFTILNIVDLLIDTLQEASSLPACRCSRSWICCSSSRSSSQISDWLILPDSKGSEISWSRNEWGAKSRVEHGSSWGQPKIIQQFVRAPKQRSGRELITAIINDERQPGFPRVNAVGSMQGQIYQARVEGTLQPSERQGLKRKKSRYMNCCLSSPCDDSFFVVTGL